MDLIIQTVDGNFKDHPILIENFLQIFPNVDLNNLPEGFARFKRVDALPPGPYEEYVGCSYEKHSDGYFYDSHSYRQFTEEEKIAKQNQVKQDWIDNDGYPSWIFNADICMFQPPVPYPRDGNTYIWNEKTLSWKLVQSKPEPISISTLDFS